MNKREHNRQPQPIDQDIKIGDVVEVVYLRPSFYGVLGTIGTVDHIFVDGDSHEGGNFEENFYRLTPKAKGGQFTADCLKVIARLNPEHYEKKTEV